MLRALTAISVLLCTSVAAIAQQLYTNPANGHQYAITPSLPWWEAEAYAQSLGGHLVTINDAAENAWVLATFGSQTPRKLWIGLSNTDRINATGSWAWANGESYAYRNWATGQPDNNGGGTPHEPYVEMAVTGGTAGKWNDVWNVSAGDVPSGNRGVVEIPAATITDPAILGGPITNRANGHRYYILRPSTWTEAAAKARELGGYLVTVNNAAENAWLQGIPLACSTCGSANVSSFWIGYSAPYPSTNWQWQSGTASAYSSWFAGPLPGGWGALDVNTGFWNSYLPSLQQDLHAVVEIDAEWTGTQTIDWTLDPRVPWNDTGFDLPPGRWRLRCTAEGASWFSSPQLSYNFTDPDGRDSSGNSLIAGSGYVATGLTSFSLVGKVSAGGTPFQLGTNVSEILLVGPGRVYLGYNDNLSFYGDNSGSYNVQLVFEPVDEITLDDTPVQIAACVGAPLNLPGVPKDNLVLIVHGWNGIFGDTNGAHENLLVNLKNTIIGELGAQSANWDVVSYDWSQCASPYVSFIPTFAVIKAEQIGPEVGAALNGAQSLRPGAYSHIHIIAHSAGSWMVPGILKEISDNTSVHVTFLDAYVPTARLALGYYPDMRDSEIQFARYYSEHYFTRGPRLNCALSWLCNITAYGSPPGLLPVFTTQSVMPHSFNVDVTAQNGCECDLYGANAHGFPIEWYKQSTSIVPDCELEPNGCCDQSPVGFNLSKEMADVHGQPWNYETLAALPTTPACVMGGSADDPPTYSDPRITADPLLYPWAGSLTGVSTGPGSWYVATASPVWLNIAVPATQRVNRIEADVIFESPAAARGTLVVYWDGFPVYVVDEVIDGGAPVHVVADMVDQEPGNHVLSFRLDVPDGASGSVAEIASVVLSQFAEPTCATFVEDPVSVDSVARGNVVFEALAIGVGEIEYQWQLNGVNLTDGVRPDGTMVSGATTPTLTMSNLQDESSGAIRCIASNGCQPATSFVAQLALICAPCPADFDMNGGVDGGDLAAFFTDFEAGAACADVDLNGGIDGGDLAAFFAVFEQGGC